MFGRSLGYACRRGGRRLRGVIVPRNQQFPSDVCRLAGQRHGAYASQAAQQAEAGGGEGQSDVRLRE